jgi:hypothetical protein
MQCERGGECVRFTSQESRIALGIGVPIFVLLFLIFFPFGAFSAIQQALGFTNTLLISVIIVLGGGIAIATSFPKVRTAERSLVILALLLIGVIVGVAAFVALAVSGLLIEILLFHSRRSRM